MIFSRKKWGLKGVYLLDLGRALQLFGATSGTTSSTTLVVHLWNSTAHDPRCKWPIWLKLKILPPKLGIFNIADMIPIGSFHMILGPSKFYFNHFRAKYELLMGFSWVGFLVSLFGMHMFCILMSLFGGSLCLMKVTRCWIWRFWAFWISTAPLSPDFKAPNINPPNRSNSPHQDGDDDDDAGSGGGAGIGAAKIQHFYLILKKVILNDFRHLHDTWDHLKLS